MTSARFRGKSFPDWSEGGNPDPGDFGEWAISDDLRDRLAELSRLDIDGVARWTSTAVLEVSNPFSPGFVLGHLRLHAEPWPGQGLMAQDLWARVDGLLGGALSDFEKGDTGNGIVKLAQIRVELRKAFPDLDLTTKYDDPKPEEIPAGSSAYQTFLQVHDRRLAAKVLDFDVGYTIGATGAGMFPAPADGTMFAPPIDADGTFSVSWGRPVSRVQTVCGVLSTGCKDAILGYILESATVPTFTDAKVVYAGSAQQFKANQFTTGPHFFRVKARMRRCQGPNFLSWEQWTCSADEPGAVEAETGYYAIGPNVTIVAPR